jgi:phage repressor protein C with HTH and peptisase S24 domain
MLTHAQIWTAIDQLAAKAELTPSGLARRAGLDATAFNKSKRMAASGRPRWPSMESVARALNVTGVSLAEFAEMVDGRNDKDPHP